ncbi:hypothetical protein ACOMHN_024584 [Nucella lapillus]
MNYGAVSYHYHSDGTAAAAYQFRAEDIQDIQWQTQGGSNKGTSSSSLQGAAMSPPITAPTAMQQSLYTHHQHHQHQQQQQNPHTPTMWSPAPTLYGPPAGAPTALTLSRQAYAAAPPAAAPPTANPAAYGSYTQLPSGMSGPDC